MVRGWMKNPAPIFSISLQSSLREAISIFSKPGGRACAAGETPQSHCQPATPEAESVAAVQALPFRRYSAGDALETLIRHPAAACAMFRLHRHNAIIS